MTASNRQDSLEVMVARIDERTRSIGQKLEEFIRETRENYFRREEAEDLYKKTISLEKNQTWIVRLVLGIMISSLLALVLRQGVK